MSVRNKKYFIGILIKSVTLIVLLGFAYTWGTFVPNKHALEDFNKLKEHDFSERFQSFATEPSFEFADNQTFIQAVYRCIDYVNFTTDIEYRVPAAIIASMAIIESAYGTSRFAEEGNALFGVRTWDLDNVPHLKPMAIPNAKFGVKKYKTKCQSVKDMVRIINNHPAYEEFRIEREKQSEIGYWDYKKLVDGLASWSINDQYTDMILQTIESNNLR
jgi:uncharacterized FlgJ-related protein